MIFSIIFFIIFLALIILLVILFFPKAKQRLNIRERRNRQRSRIIRRRRILRQLEEQDNFFDDDIYLPYIGDISCNYNARSPYLRCAVNPEGPCENCPHYQSKSTDHNNTETF